MWVRLKDENGIVSLVNLSQAKYIQPAVNSKDEQGVRIVWQHDTFTDHGDMDLPDESCVYSEQIFTGVSVLQIEMLLSKVGLTYPPTENGSETGAKKVMEAPATEDQKPDAQDEAPAPEDEAPAPTNRKKPRG